MALLKGKKKLIRISYTKKCQIAKLVMDDCVKKYIKEATFMAFLAKF